MAACSLGKWPLALVALRNLAFRLSMALVSGMKYVTLWRCGHRGFRFGGYRVRGVQEEQLGQAVVTA
jgi:hypothetical protein